MKHILGKDEVSGSIPDISSTGRQPEPIRAPKFVGARFAFRLRCVRDKRMNVFCTKINAD